MVGLNARRFAVGVLAVLVAGSLSFPSAALALDQGEVDGTLIANGTPASEAGSGGGSWSYDGADTITLDNFVGGAIVTIGNTSIDLNGKNSVAGIMTVNGDLTINGDSEAAGDAKPSLTMTPYDARADEADEADESDAGDAGDSTFTKIQTYSGDLTIKDAHVIGNADTMQLETNGGNVAIVNSKIERANSNMPLNINADNQGWADEGSYDLSIKGSDLDVTSIFASYGTLTIENSDVTVTHIHNPGEAQAELPWSQRAVLARKIVLKGEQENYTIHDVVFGSTPHQAVSTGSEEKVELRAVEKPAYYGATTKGAPASTMPATGDTTMLLVAWLGTTALAAAAAVAWALRTREAQVRGKHTE